MDQSRSEFLATLGLLAADGAPAGAAERSAADLGTLFPSLQALAGDAEFAWSFLGRRFDNHAAFRRAARAKVLEVLSYSPPPTAPRPDVRERADCGDYVREKILFSTSPHVRVPAYVLTPKGLRGRAPAIVDLHSHGGMFVFGKEKVIDFGENHPAMTVYHKENYDSRPTATALVKRGYVVIAIDAFGFGERRLRLDEDARGGDDRSTYSAEDAVYLSRQCATKEATMVKSLAIAGMTWPGIVVTDDMRTVDYLVTRPEVDPERIGCLGISMGGYRSLYLAALDERIRAACVTGFMSTVRPMLRAHIDTHSFVHFLPGLHRYLDFPDIASMTAPRALLVQQCSRDQLFPPPGMKESAAKIAAAYRKASCADQFSGRFYDEPHRFTVAMQEEAFAWFDSHVKEPV
jgi:dienelactone hydrolase